MTLFLFCPTFSPRFVRLFPPPAPCGGGFQSLPMCPCKVTSAPCRGAFGLRPMCPCKVTSAPCGGAFGLRPRCARKVTSVPCGGAFGLCQCAPAKSHLHPAGGFWSSPKMRPGRAAGWDEESPGIRPQGVYHTTRADPGDKKAGLRGNAKRFLPQRPWIIENKRQCMGLSLLANP